MPHAIGQIVPSSNRTVERATHEVLRQLPGVACCFARIPYFGVGQGQPVDRYDVAAFTDAATLLGHARVDAVSWNGTRGALTGLAGDQALCATMAEACGCAATTAALDTRALLGRLGISHLGIVTPGDAGYAERSAAGLGVVATGVHAFGIADNFAAGEVPEAAIAAAATELARTPGCQAILLWSTNLAGFGVMARLEDALGLPVLDSACIGIRGALLAAGIDPRAAARLGSLFAVAPGPP